MTDTTSTPVWAANKPRILDRWDLPTIIAILIVLAFIVLVYLALFVKLPTDQTALAVISTLIGNLAMKFGTVVDFLFGSSSGSKAKDDALISSAKG